MGKGQLGVGEVLEYSLPKRGQMVKSWPFKGIGLFKRVALYVCNVCVEMMNILRRNLDG